MALFQLSSSATAGGCLASRPNWATSSGRLRQRPMRCNAMASWEAGSITRQVLSRSQRGKLDMEDDRVFYREPRIVEHVDDGFLAQVTELYRKRIPAGGVVLDLCSSWVSHLPQDVQYSRVIGHGMNAQELARNRRLSEWFIRDLNTNPDGWALESGSVDGVIICVSVQYLCEPERVFAEIFRVLKPGGCVIVSFSNRQFYNKAIQAWRDSTGYGRVQLVKSYFSAVAGFTAAEAITEVGAAQPAGNPIAKLLQKLWQSSQSDPFYAVVAYRNFKRTDE